MRLVRTDMFQERSAIDDLAMGARADQIAAATRFTLGVCDGTTWTRCSGSGPIAFAPDGQRFIATLKHRSHVFDAEKVVPVGSPGMPMQAVAWPLTGEPVLVHYEEVERGGSARAAITSGKGLLPPAQERDRGFIAPYFRCFRAAISANGACVVFRDEYTLFAYDPVPIRPLWRIKECDPVDVVLSPDGKLGFSVSIMRPTLVFDAQRGVSLGTLDHPRLDVRKVAWSAAGARIALGCADGGVHVLDLDGSLRVVRSWSNAAPAGITALVFSGDGGTLVAGTSDGHVAVFELDSVEADR